MIKIVGFNSNNGVMKLDNGDSIPWSNRTFRCITDEGLTEKDFGLAVVEQKFKKSEVCASLGISANSSDDYVDEILKKRLNCEVELTAGRVGKEIKINGFRFIKS